MLLIRRATMVYDFNEMGYLITIKNRMKKRIGENTNCF